VRELEDIEERLVLLEEAKGKDSLKGRVICENQLLERLVRLRSKPCSQDGAL
jgi:hypothetical protein